MLSQRVRGSWEPGRKQTVKWAAEGAVKGISSEYSATQGTREMPGICLYPDECAALAAKSRWHRGFSIIRP